MLERLQNIGCPSEGCAPKYYASEDAWIIRSRESMQSYEPTHTVRQHERPFARLGFHFLKVRNEFC